MRKITVSCWLLISVVVLTILHHIVAGVTPSVKCVGEDPTKPAGDLAEA